MRKVCRARIVVERNLDRPRAQHLVYVATKTLEIVKSREETRRDVSGCEGSVHVQVAAAFGHDVNRRLILMRPLPFMEVGGARFETKQKAPRARRQKIINIFVASLDSTQV